MVGHQNPGNEEPSALRDDARQPIDEGDSVGIVADDLASLIPPVGDVNDSAGNGVAEWASQGRSKQREAGGGRCGCDQGRLGKVGARSGKPTKLPEW
ncbi:MAG: hypothetical protein LC732_05295 [Acidobacteria bacterium]|nr:hypothetical protein [Acidobacteriota bacterium]